MAFPALRRRHAEILHPSGLDMLACWRADVRPSTEGEHMRGLTSETRSYGDIFDCSLQELTDMIHDTRLGVTMEWSQGVKSPMVQVRALNQRRLSFQASRYLLHVPTR